MILGNSNKGNTGKKYLMRKNIQNLMPTDLQLQMADEFNCWFVANRDSLICEWSRNQKYNEDVFIDTYIRMCEGFLFGNITVKCFRSYFSRSYYTNYTLASIYENRFTDMEVNNFSIIDDASEILEKQQKDSELVVDVIGFVKANFSPWEYRVFLEYLDLKTYAKVAEKYGLKEYKIQRIISKIKKTIHVNTDFVNRRLEGAYKSTLRNKLSK